jgi:3alpha(or 20beta)-hydroxysteroid dehydrogenase
MNGSFGLTDRIALVTGAGSGIGRAVAELLAAEGARVAVADINRQAAHAVADHLGDGALAVPLDVTSPEGWTAAVASVDGAFGGLHILYNGAGIIETGPILDLAIEAYRRQIEVNQFGTYLGMRAAAPLIERSGGGAIVNTSSINGMRGYRNSSAYAASKTAILSLTMTAAHEFAEKGIRVNAVVPGFIDTAMHHGVSPETQEIIARSVQLPGRMGTPLEIARAVAFLVSDLSSYVTGTDLLVDGGVTLGGAS